MAIGRGHGQTRPNNRFFHVNLAAHRLAGGDFVIDADTGSVGDRIAPASLKNAPFKMRQPSENSPQLCAAALVKLPLLSSCPDLPHGN
jgi:hypothetical protein